MFEKHEKVGNKKQGMNRTENLLDLYCSEGEREPVFATPAGGWRELGRDGEERREKGEKQTRRKRKKMDLNGRREKKKRRVGERPQRGKEGRSRRAQVGKEKPRLSRLEMIFVLGQRLLLLLLYFYPLRKEKYRAMYVWFNKKLMQRKWVWSK